MVSFESAMFEQAKYVGRIANMRLARTTIGKAMVRRCSDMGGVGEIEIDDGGPLCQGCRFTLFSPTSALFGGLFSPLIISLYQLINRTCCYLVFIR